MEREEFREGRGSEEILRFRSRYLFSSDFIYYKCDRAFGLELILFSYLLAARKFRGDENAFNIFAALSHSLHKTDIRFKFQPQYTSFRTDCKIYNIKKKNYLSCVHVVMMETAVVGRFLLNHYKRKSCCDFGLQSLFASLCS